MHSPIGDFRSSISTAGALLAVVVLGACATPASQTGMTVPSPAAASSMTVPAELRNEIAVKDVIGGKETNPLWLSNIASSDFEAALEASLRNVGLGSVGRQTGRYQLAASLQNVEQPVIGASLTVTTTVHYDLIERTTNKTTWASTITRPYTAQFSDSFLASERLKLANEGSARANIQAFIEELLKSWTSK